MREGYWKYFHPTEEGATGLTPVFRPAYYDLGIAWHYVAERLLAGYSGADAAVPALEYAEKCPSLGVEEKNWLLAAALAWERVRREEFFDQYDVVTIEEEVDVTLSPGTVLRARADAVVQDRNNGTYWVWNWKTTSQISGWTRKWFYDIQAWTESLAMEGHLGVPVQGCIFEGVWKGPYWNGQMNSRLVYGYKRWSDSMNGYVYTTEAKGSPRPEKFPVWEESFPFGDGVAAWISWISKGFLQNHFAVSAPQFRDDALVEAWLRAIVRREDDISHVADMGNNEELQDFFVQNFSDSNCPRCPYADLCMRRSTPEALIEEGVLEPRDDSHMAPKGEKEEGHDLSFSGCTA